VGASLERMIRPQPFSTRLRLMCGGLPVLVAAAALAASPSAAATRESLKTPLLADIGAAATPITDSILSKRATRSLAAAASWGGTFTTSAGDQVSIHVSDSYPVDNTRAQRWADFLGSLVHGSEISTVQVYLAPLDEVQQYCGQDALACYNPTNKLLVAPGDDPSSELSAEAVVTHEYGHHVANSRNDAPWLAIDYGTKRWASYVQVCSKAQAGQLFPGAESDSRYQLNPGEGFAESYRVLNQHRLGVPESPWQVVSQSLYPDATALSLIQQDVLTHWTEDADAQRRHAARRDVPRHDPRGEGRARRRQPRDEHRRPRRARGRDRDGGADADDDRLRIAHVRRPTEPREGRGADARGRFQGLVQRPTRTPPRSAQARARRPSPRGGAQGALFTNPLQGFSSIPPR